MVWLTHLLFASILIDSNELKLISYIHLDILKAKELEFPIRLYFFISLLLLIEYTVKNPSGISLKITNTLLRNKILINLLFIELKHSIKYFSWLTTDLFSPVNRNAAKGYS